MTYSTGVEDGNVRSVPAPGNEAGQREAIAERLQRWVLGVTWAMKPPRLLGVPATLSMLAAHYLGFTPYKKGELPDPNKALNHPDGLAGICDDMSVDTLMRAYARGLYPFCHIGPMKWWAPRQRMVLFPNEFHIEKNLRRRLRNKHFRVTFDQDFDAVMRGCAEARPGRWHLTWITPEMMRAYKALFDAGHAHSVEVWDQHGSLVGGAYGVAVGCVFFTESQFTRMRDSSKVGFAILNRHLQHWGFVLNDGKHKTGHLQQLGFRLIPRDEFNAILDTNCSRPGKPGKWAVDEGLDIGSWQPSECCSKPAG